MGLAHATAMFRIPGTQAEAPKREQDVQSGRKAQLVAGVEAGPGTARQYAQMPARPNPTSPRPVPALAGRGRVSACGRVQVH